MRNILIFPDGTRNSFKYPDDQEFDVGSQLQIDMKDDSIHILTVDSIEFDHTNKSIYYHLAT